MSDLFGGAGLPVGLGGTRLYPVVQKKQGRVIVWDVETSGFSPRCGARVIEIAGLSIEDGKPAEIFSTFVNSVSYVPAKITELTGIRTTDLKGQPGPELVFPSFMDFVGNSPLVAHNNSFDHRFLDFELQQQGYHMANERICSMKLARQKLPGLPSYKLKDVYAHLFGETPQTHRAADDVMLLAGIWLVLNP